MAGFRIRRGQQEFPVPDIDALIRLAREGRLQPADPVGTADGWIEARQIPELRPFLSDDPWSAWEEAEDLDAKDVYREALQSSPEAMDLPVHALSPLMVVGDAPTSPVVEEPEPLSLEPLSLEPLSLEPLSLEPLSLEPLSLEPLSLEPLPPDDDSSEFDEPLDNTTSVFTLPVKPLIKPPVKPPAAPPTTPDATEPPRPPLTVHSGRTPRPGTTTKPGIAHRSTTPPRPPRTEHLPDGNELIHLPRPHAPDLPRPRPPRQAFRAVRVLTWLFIGVLLMLMGYATVRLSAPRPPVAQISPPAPAENPLQAVDRDLRSAIPLDPRPIKAAGDFTDILTIELQQIGVDVSLVDALITQWGGRPSEQQPQAAEIRVTIRTRGAIERELGAIGLIVGRYVHLYRLKVPVFEVVVHSADGSYKRSFEAQRADQLYAGTLSLENYLR